MEEKPKMLCERCGVELVESEVEFSYLNRSFRHKTPRCPECGQVYLSEALTSGRMNEVEKLLEDK